MARVTTNCIIREICRCPSSYVHLVCLPSPTHCANAHELQEVKLVNALGTELGIAVCRASGFRYLRNLTTAQRLFVMVIMPNMVRRRGEMAEHAAPSEAVW